MCKLPDKAINCEACSLVTTSNRSLKRAQNEAFQDGIDFIIHKLIEVNKESQTFDQLLFEPIVRAHAMIFGNAELYEVPKCECSEIADCECKR